MKLLSSLIGLVPMLTFGATDHVPELPVESFFRSPELTQMRLSPDGKFVVAITHDHGKGLLFGINLETGARKAIITGEIYAFSWLTNERLLFWAGGVGLGGLFAINRDGSKNQVLQRPFVLQIDNPNFRFQLVHALMVPPGDPDCLLIERAEWYPFGRPEFPHPNVLRVNFFTGKTALEERNPGKVVHWLTDSRGVVRAGFAVEKDMLKVLYRRDKQQPWRIISESPFDRLEIQPVGFAPDEDLLYVAARAGKDTLGLYSFDPMTRELGKCFWQDPQFDPFAPIIVGRTNQLAGVIYESDRLRVEWFDDRFKALQAKADASLPGTVNLWINSSRDGNKHLFKAVSERSPGDYYLLDTSRNEFGPIGKVAGWINPEQMAEMKPILYRSRDDLAIHGYLTVPVGRQGTNLPLVVMPHGGPRLRDTWQFVPEVQFLANRGYAVLQMNFRGSTGYGWAFLQAGNKQWGRKMQDDISDGVKWAIEQGIADKNRIAIFGASYGGYAALMGLISTPDLFKCGICYAGVTDIRSQLKHNIVRLAKQFEAIEQERIGDYREEKEDLDAISPLRHVDKIQAPLLLAYGGRDPIVSIQQGKQLAKALGKARKKFEMVIEENEGHGFGRETNRFKLFRKIDQFLKANLY